MAKAQVNQAAVMQAHAVAQSTGVPQTVSLYGDLGLDELMQSYGGLDISKLSLTHYVPSVGANTTS